MNDAQLSQTAGKAETRQPGLLVKPTQIVLSNCFAFYEWTLIRTTGKIFLAQGHREVNPKNLATRHNV